MRVLLQTAVPEYRLPPFSSLAEAIPDLLIVTGGEYFEADITTTPNAESLPIELVRNKFFAGRRGAWQSGVLRRAITAEVLVAELNPRVVTTWIAVVVRRLLRRRTVLWGHATRRGETRVRPARLAMLKWAGAVVAYTHTQAQLLRDYGVKTFVAPNALLPRSEMLPAVASPRDSILYVGRLVAEKRPGRLVDAFSDYLEASGDTGARLLIVGSGAEEEVLRRRIRNSETLQQRVTLFGQVTSQAQLRSIYRAAAASVSPGYVGLSITQSLSFGVPMIVSRNEAHSPEIEAAIDGRTARLVSSPEQWTSAIADALDGSLVSWTAEEISAFARERYALESMVIGLIEAFDT